MSVKRFSIVLLAGLLMLAPVANAVAFAEGDSGSGPEEVVEQFYDEYLSFFHASDTERTFPPEGWYRDSELLTADFIAELDAFADRYDPLLCAQDVPTAFLVEEAALSEDDDSARVIVRTNFANYHAFEVLLAQDGAQWRIEGVECQGVENTPEGVVAQFYLIYLSYNEWDGEGRHPNFLVDGLYRVLPLVSDSLIEDMDALLGGDSPVMADPFICAQDVPDFVELGDVDIDGDSALVSVRSSFPNHSLSVKLAQTGDEWVITGFVCAAAE